MVPVLGHLLHQSDTQSRSWVPHSHRCSSSCYSRLKVRFHLLLSLLGQAVAFTARTDHSFSFFCWRCCLIFHASAALCFMRMSQQSEKCSRDCWPTLAELAMLSAVQAFLMHCLPHYDPWSSSFVALVADFVRQRWSYSCLERWLNHHFCQLAH